MKLTIVKVTEEGFQEEEYTISALKGAEGGLIAAKIEGKGWYSFEAQDYSSFQVTE